MKRLREKLHSKSGMSILLALLMFLVCAMVAASVLGAAASNAGKIRSNQVEHQKYLTLSSAMRLICDELERAEYIGQYQVYEWETPAETDNKGNIITPAKYYFYVEQRPGEYSCGDLTAQLPLGKELDAIFGEQFNKLGYGKLTTNIVTNQVTHRLTVTLPDGLDGYPYPKAPDNPTAYEVSRKVTVEVTLNHDTRHITVKAWLGGGDAPPEDDSNTMSAELVAKIADASKGLKDGNPLVIDYSPGGQIPGDSPSGAGDSRSTSTMKWELHWIKKGAA